MGYIPREAESGKEWILVFATADVSITSDDTLTADPDLRFDVGTGTDYEFRFVVYYNSHVSADFKYSLSGPASPTRIVYQTAHLPPDVALGGPVTAAAHTAFGDVVSITSATETDGSVFIEGVVTVGATAGTIAFEWAQNTSNGGTTLRKWGSYVEYRKVI